MDQRTRKLVFLFGRLFSRREAEAEAGRRETKEEAQREWKGERERERGGKWRRNAKREVV